MHVWESMAATAKKVWSDSFFKKGTFTTRMAALGFVGVLLILAGGYIDSSPAKPKTPVATDTAKVQPPVAHSYEESLENKLENLLSQVKGAGAVAVSVILEDNIHEEYAKNTTKESRTIQEKDNGGGIRTTTESKETEQVLMGKENGVDKPVIAREIKPTIKGVVVVAEGAQDSQVKANLTKAVETGLGIPAYKVTVIAERK